ncbi:hypothetical protein MKW92_034461 [Papaver armeniacum]|nr:hypothetical protein MKW92_034461 [Papaver armeniacum]
MIKLRISEVMSVIRDSTVSLSFKRIGSALIFGFGCIIGVSVLILTAIIFMFPSISSSLMNPMLQNNLNRYYHKISSPHSSQSSPSGTTTSSPPPPPPPPSSSPPPPPPQSQSCSTSRLKTWTQKENLLSYSNTAYGGDDEDSSDGDCDIYDGEWVRDVNQEPYYPPGSCPYIEKQPFDCYFNGKRDNEYLNWQWQWKSHPRNTGCSKNIPSFFNGTDFLERLRGKKLVLSGDSLNRNMYESLDYNCTVAYVWSVFLVNETNSKTPSVYQDADIVVFDSYHWWVEGKLIMGKEGDYLYPKLEINKAFKNIDSAKTQVVFRGFSLSHYRRKWNTGGKCNLETEPITSKEKYINPDQSQLTILEDTLRKMKTPVIYMNVSKLTYYRSDGHPSLIAAIQDCSHWCLPGVPDTWNELYISLVKAGKGSFGLPDSKSDLWIKSK